MLHSDGRLESPWGEKVEGEENLFAIRIRKGGNARFFYAYDDGTAVWILNGYETRSANSNAPGNSRGSTDYERKTDDKGRACGT